MDVKRMESIMRIQVSNNGKTIEGKELFLFGNGIGEMDTRTHGERYLGVLLHNREPLSDILRNHGKHRISIYFHHKIVYIDVTGDKYHYVLNLNKDSTQLCAQIERDKTILLAILSDDESKVEYSVIEDIIIE